MTAIPYAKYTFNAYFLSQAYHLTQKGWDQLMDKNYQMIAVLKPLLSDTPGTLF